MKKRYQETLEEIAKELEGVEKQGEVPSYIPELAKVDPSKFGMYLKTLEGEEYEIGDSREKFSIQSISKVLSLSMAISLIGNEVWKRVGVEPSGNPFNSIVQLEYEHGIPRNPFINAGAIVVADILVSQLQDPEAEFLEYVRGLSKNADINYNHSVSKSEKEVGYMNASLAYMMKEKGNLNNSVERVLDFYYLQCSLEMTCAELAEAFRDFGDTGDPFGHGPFTLTSSEARRVNALMLTCGFYDESGEFAFEVGLPGKSGVGGAIVALYPEKYCVSVWSPPLNKKGNSEKGMKALELLTTKIEGSIF
ncbi:glutaminase [Reichenbachiella ulvae]|uniref:Glutaminase n=1 Tax=Reichenbachiella ulvae TaxID=2980104 RepID=A0ABT3CP29_9BACT|nr:glutaminase [Reichenbachiella ulvae]MCV9385224.1 glutaminase [Reichenbachiella ulvae]